jgi:Protein of unknown function (DUF2510)
MMRLQCEQGEARLRRLEALRAARLSMKPDSASPLTLEDLEQYAGAPAAWCPDPAGRHDYRWWDGSRWTEYASDGGRRLKDPL